MSSSTIVQLTTCLACMLMVQQAANAARIKISIPEGYSKEWHRMKRQSQTSCDDVVEVARSSLTLPGRLNELDNRVKFWRSASARDNLEDFQTTAVPGLGGTTVGGVFKVLRDESCFPFFYGGAVRDQFLGALPNDADVEADCTIEKLLDVCMRNWGPDNCTNKYSIVTIGNAQPGLEDVDLASTDITFYASLNRLEYTVNSMAYDVNGNNVIIDLTGTGKTDVCNRSIRIPSVDGSRGSWDLWVEESPIKLFRFWKLREKKFTAYNDATLTYIVQESQRLIDKDYTRFASFYCEKVFGRQSTYNKPLNECQVPSSMCQDGFKKAMVYNAVLAEDFGDYWTTHIVPNVLPSIVGCEDSTPSGEDSTPSGEDSTPSSEDSTPSGEDSTPSGAVSITGKVWLLTCAALLYQGVTTFR